MRRLNVGKRGRDLAEHALPQRVSLRHRIALVRHAQPCAPVCACPLEGVPHDAVHALPGVHFLLDGDLVLGPRLHAPAHGHVQSLGILPEDRDVYLGRRPFLQRTEPRVEQRHRPVVHVEIELEPDAEQDVARMAVVGNPWIPERADEHRVELVAEHRIPVRRDGDAGLQDSSRQTTGAPRSRTCARRPHQHAGSLGRLRRRPPGRCRRRGLRRDARGSP